MTIRVLVADDHAAVRAGIVLILDGHDDIEVVGEAADGERRRAGRGTPPRRGADGHPDAELDGIAATRGSRRARLTVKVLILTTFDMDEYVFGALRAGASGFLLKDTERTTW